jgi:hypothetical protein
MAATSEPGSNCHRGCPFELCPYPPKGEQNYRAELSEAFCRRQHSLMTGGWVRRRAAPWQEALAGELKQFWKQMGQRAQPAENDRDVGAERTSGRARRASGLLPIVAGPIAVAAVAQDRVDGLGGRCRWRRLQAQAVYDRQVVVHRLALVQVQRFGQLLQVDHAGQVALGETQDVQPPDRGVRAGPEGGDLNGHIRSVGCLEQC